MKNIAIRNETKKKMFMKSCLFYTCVLNQIMSFFKFKFSSNWLLLDNKYVLKWLLWWNSSLCMNSNLCLNLCSNWTLIHEKKFVTLYFVWDITSLLKTSQPNVLQAAFMLKDPKSAKRHLWLDCLFPHLVSALIKAAHKHSSLIDP